MRGIVAVVFLGWLACSEESALSQLGESCTLTSDCDAGLECLYGACHEACAASKDCPQGRCVVGVAHVRVCQPDGDSACRFDSECAPNLVCGIDGHCRNQCAADRDCVPGQVCVTATCADPEELSNGRLPPAEDVDPLGKPCRYSSDCLPGENGLILECDHGECAYACFEERDCPRFYRCTSSDPAVAGNCELIGTRGSLFCDPEDEPYDCECFGTAPGTQPCKQDGSGLEPCMCN